MPEEEVAPVKTAETPHYISIGLSIAAILISCFSWWEVRRSRLISQSSNRAVAYVTDLKVLPNQIEDFPAF